MRQPALLLANFAKNAPGCGCRSHSPHSHRFRTLNCRTVDNLGENSPQSVMRWAGLENDPGISPFSRPGNKNVHRRHPCRIRGLMPTPAKGGYLSTPPHFVGTNASKLLTKIIKEKDEEYNTRFPRCSAQCAGVSHLRTDSQQFVCLKIVGHV